MEKVTQKQFLKARRKVAFEWITFSIGGSLLGIFGFWFLLSIVSWTCVIGDWPSWTRLVLSILSFVWTAFIISNVSNHCHAEFHELKQINSKEELNGWCRRYGFKYI